MLLQSESSHSSDPISTHVAVSRIIFIFIIREQHKNIESVTINSILSRGYVALYIALALLLCFLYDASVRCLAIDGVLSVKLLLGPTIALFL